jgi:hypothetical protein
MSFLARRLLTNALSSVEVEQTWNLISPSIGGALYRITYGEGRFVAVSYGTTSNEILYSDDAITWTTANITTSQNLFSIIYNKNSNTFSTAQYGSNSSNIYFYSNDGVTWTQVTLPFNGYWRLCYGYDNVILATTGQTGIWRSIYSTDNGLTWTTGTISAPVIDQVYGNGKFVALRLPLNASYVSSPTNQALYSVNNGATWFTSTLPYTISWSRIQYGNGIYIAIGGAESDLSSPTNKAAYSYDGITWYPSEMPYTKNWSSIIYAEGKFYCIANGSKETAYSEDGINWFPFVNLPEVSQWTDLTYGEGKLVAVSSNNKIAFLDIPSYRDELLYFDPYLDVYKSSGLPSAKNIIGEVATWGDQSIFEEDAKQIDIPGSRCIWREDSISRSIEFSLGDYLKIPNFFYGQYSGSITVSMWINVFEAWATSRAFWHPLDDGTGSIEITIPSNLDFQFTVRVNGSVYYERLGNTGSFNTWYHLVGTVSNNIIKFYVNGNYTGPSSMPVGTEINKYNPNDLQLGGGYFQGRIGHCHMFNKELTQQEITTLYNKELPFYTNNPLILRVNTSLLT